MAEQITPRREQTDLLAELPADAPVVMINLLAFKRPDGEAHYRRYAREVAPHLEAVGAKVVFAGAAAAVLVGASEMPWWDAILAVQYPTPQAFLAMVTSESYGPVHSHREAALERAELIATGAWQLAG